jgi:hypothetical protein
MHQRHVTTGLVLLLLSAAPLHAQISVLSAERDATLYEQIAPPLANGSGQFLFAGRTLQGLQGQRRRALLRFDLTAIPSRANIEQVELHLECLQFQGGTTPMSLHRVTQAWTEGASDPTGNEGQGMPALSGDCTWAHASFDGVAGGVVWAAQGGDFVTSASATTLSPGEGLHVWTGAGLVADVQAMVSGTAANHGWILLGEESEPGTARRFASSEDDDTSHLRPTLTIVWSLPPSCPADLDGSGTVDAADLAQLLGAWSGSAADLDGDGITDAADLAVLLGAWGACG